MLEVRAWAGWPEFLEWLRRDGPRDTLLSPDALLYLRQDAEHTAQAGAAFSRTLDELWTVLHQHRRPHA